jgi:hypothetical protein
MSHSDYRVTSEMNPAVKCPSGTEPTQRDLHLRLLTERGRWRTPVEADISCYKPGGVRLT